MIDSFMKAAMQANGAYLNADGKLTLEYKNGRTETLQQLERRVIKESGNLAGLLKRTP